MPRDLLTARHLLERALEPVVDVRSTIDPDSQADPRSAGFVRLRARQQNREVRASLREWQGRAERLDDDALTIWVVRRATLEQLRAFRDEGFSFVDVARGVVRVILPWLYVDLSNVELPERTPSDRALRDPFGDRASLIARLLVEQPERTWTARDLAQTAGVSTMTASHVVRQLRELDVLSVRKRGRAFDVQLVDVRRLVEQWVLRYSWRQCARLSVQAPVGSPERFLRRLPDAMRARRWALTMQAGASLVAPHAEWDTVHLYVDVPNTAALHDVAREAGWDPGNGKVVLLRPWYAQSAWVGARRVHELPVVSDLQLIIDLWRYPVRGREQGEHLLDALAARVEHARETHQPTGAE